MISQLIVDPKLGGFLDLDSIVSILEREDVSIDHKASIIHAIDPETLVNHFLYSMPSSLKAIPIDLAALLRAKVSKIELNPEGKGKKLKRKKQITEFDLPNWQLSTASLFSHVRSSSRFTENVLFNHLLIKEMKNVLEGGNKEVRAHSNRFFYMLKQYEEKVEEYKHLKKQRSDADVHFNLRGELLSINEIQSLIDSNNRLMRSITYMMPESCFLAELFSSIPIVVGWISSTGEYKNLTLYSNITTCAYLHYFLTKGILPNTRLLESIVYALEISEGRSNLHNRYGIYSSAKGVIERQDILNSHVKLDFIELTNAKELPKLDKNVVYSYADVPGFEHLKKYKDIFAH